MPHCATLPKWHPPDHARLKPRVALSHADSHIRLTKGIVEPDQLFRRLFDGVKHLPPTGGRLWTGAVKKTLRAFAQETDRAPVVYPDRGNPEFLLDVVWLKPAREDAREGNGRIVLAVESEWSSSFDEVWCDFSKLLYVKAPRKVLICDLSPKMIQEALRQFEQDIIDAGGLEAQEKYIVINFGNQYAECWSCGSPEPVRFQKGPRRRY